MEAVLFKRIYLWAVLLLALIGIVGAIYASHVVKAEEGARARFQRGSHGQLGELAHSVASLPGTISSVLFAEAEPRGADHSDRLDDRPAGWTRYGTGVPIPGYLLLSRIDGDADRSVIELVDMADFSVKHRWAPAPDLLMEGVPQISKIVPYTQWSNRRYRALHPLLLDDGRIVFTGQFSPLFMLSACGELIWRQDTVTFHHSVNIDADGNFWAPSLIEPSDVTALETFRDDAITRISPTGEITLQRSMAELLIANGRSDLIYQNFNDDPLHMNDIEPVDEDGPYWKKGDVFISMRHVSLAVLYRPSTDEILWIRQGPWLAQHDIDIIDDHTIALFNNNYGSRGNGGRVFGNTDVLFYDFATDQVTSPYGAAMGADMGDHFVSAGSNGLMDFTPSGHMIVEEDTAGRLLIYGPDKTLAAEYINRADSGVTYRMAWSRYVPKPQGDSALAALEACGGQVSALIDG